MTRIWLSLKTLIISAVILPIAHYANAAQEITTTSQQVSENLTVTATRLNQTVSEVGSSVAVITADEIDALGYDFVLDAIASVPAVTINQNGSFGGIASVRIRGASSEQTLVLIDGVVVNDTSSPGGGFDFARLDTANIERIEILKGPQSTLWGTDAIGGVVSIITKQPSQPLSGSVFAEFGNDDYSRAGVSIEGANERGDFRLGISRTDIEGISKADEDNGNRETDPFESTTVSARGGLHLPAGARIDVAALWTDADTEFDSFVFGAQGNAGDGDELSETEELSGNIQLTLPLFDGRLENTLLVGYADIERNNFTNGLAGFSADGERLNYRYQGNLNISEAHQFAFGIEREEIETGDEDSSLDGIFGLYQYQPIETLTLSAGVRSDDVESFGRETTARFAVAYNPTAQLTVRGSWGEGFKAPTIFQTTFFCCGASLPNPDLQPEVSDAYDIGVEWRSEDGRAHIGATYFDQTTENLIIFSFASGGFANITEAESTGAELSFGYKITNWLAINGNYAQIDAIDQQGDRLIRVPEHTGDLSIALDPNGPLSMNLLIRYNSDEEDTTGVVDSWTRVDLAARYQIKDNIQLFARVENLFDEDYQQLLGFGTPGLSLSGGLRVNF